MKPSDIRSLDDLTRVLISRKSDLREFYRFSLFAVPLDRVLRLHVSLVVRLLPASQLHECAY